MSNPPARYLDAATLQALLTPDLALEAVQAFFGTQGADAVTVPPRIHLNVPGRETVGLYMPAATAQYVGVKLVHLMPHQRPAVAAEIFLYDADTGALLFWGDGRPLTGLRTAAVSTAASLRLKPRARRLLVYGAGVQAAAHLVAMAGAYPDLEAPQVACRGEASFERLQGLLPDALRGRVVRATDPDAALAAADLVVTTTPAPEPLFAWNQVPEGAHVAAVGSATAKMRELPPGLFTHSQVWLDTEQALREAGDCQAAVEAGWQPESGLCGDLFGLLGGAPPAPAPRTLFKSVGHAAQDLALLTALWRQLQATERGTANA